MAVAQGMSVETKDNVPSMSTLINAATAFGIGLALAILAMSVGLVRSETAGDLRVLAATGASSWARHMLSAATAGGLALLGALLGTVAGYVGMIGLVERQHTGRRRIRARERACRQPARHPARDARHRRGARVGAIGQRAPGHCPARHRVRRPRPHQPGPGVDSALSTGPARAAKSRASPTVRRQEVVRIRVALGARCRPPISGTANYDLTIM